MHRRLQTSELPVSLGTMHLDETEIPQGWEQVPATRQEIAALDQMVEAVTPEDEDLPLENWNWMKLRHVELQEFAWLRVVRHGPGDERHTVTGFVSLPKVQNTQLANNPLRTISFSGLERSLDIQRSSFRYEGTRAAHKKDDGWVPTDPVGKPKEHEDFYVRVAMQFEDFRLRGEANPVSAMMDLNGSPRKTVQGWILEARKRGYLPPGKPGRISNA